MIKHILHISLTICIVTSNLSVAPKNNGFKLISTKTEFIAGETIILKFKHALNTTPMLYISNSFGTTVLYGTKTEQTLSYPIPGYMATSAGIIDWVLLEGSHSLKGTLKIVPQPKAAIIETYVGPPSIIAGNSDVSMLVAIPADVYGNTLINGTQVQVSQQFKNHITTSTISTQNGLAYKNLSAPKQTGRMLLGLSCNGFYAKEYDVNIMPSTPTGFTIDYDRHHNFADGNQITTFSTSSIKDAYGNCIADGTYVEFLIKTQNNSILKTYGTTINGVATAKMIHPDHEDAWSIQAHISGMAKSNTIGITYNAILTDFNIEFSKVNKSITVGPLSSFMGQMVPDGLDVKLTLIRNNKIVHTLQKQSANGYAVFKLEHREFTNGKYTVTVNAAGISKTIDSIML